MISEKHRCIFVRIPKCAGTSFERVIWPEPRSEQELWMGFIDRYHNKYQTGGLQHLKAWQICAHVGQEKFGAFFKFSIVRNPFERSASQYYCMKRRPDLMEFIGMQPEDSFEAYLTKIRCRLHVQWEPQHTFLFDEHRTMLVDYVGRVERIAEAADTIFSRIGIDTGPLPHLNRSDRPDSGPIYSQVAREMVAELYREDFALFGYSSNTVPDSTP